MLCLLFCLAVSGKDGSVANVSDGEGRSRRRLRIRQSLYRNSIGDKDGGIGVTSETDGLRYLTFGGPSTYGKGLDEKMRTSEAYPYLLSSSSSLTSKYKVRNLAGPHFDAVGPTLASLCTQTLVEGEHSPTIMGLRAGSVNSNSDLPSPVAYDVITIEYSPDVTNAATVSAYLDSMRLLIQRLRQRYPFATIVIVNLWSPLDLVYNDAESNRTVTFGEWRIQQRQTDREHSHALEENPKELSLRSIEKQEFLAAMKEHTWSYREASDENEIQMHRLETSIVNLRGVMYRMPQPIDINESLDAIIDWFLEEEEKRGDGVDSSFQYTLSREGHTKVAEGIRTILAGSILATKQRLFSATAYFHQSASGSWGAGDACQLWYETGKEGLPQPSTYTNGVKLKEYHPGQYALEIVKKGSLTVHNPFHEDRIIYLTYLTTATRIAANKVYPKTKVTIVEEQGKDLSTPSNSVLLEPCHDDNNDSLHRTRTTAVGMIPANSSGILEFMPAEEHTIHNFRIVGVSFLQQEKTPHKIPFEFNISPRRLAVQGNDDKFSDLDLE